MDNKDKLCVTRLEQSSEDDSLLWKRTMAIGAVILLIAVGVAWMEYQKAEARKLMEPVERAKEIE